MSISHFENTSEDIKHIFKLDTPNTSYVIAITDDECFVSHVYYGSKISDYPGKEMLYINEAPFVPTKNARDRGSFMDCHFFEFSTNGIGDYRESCIAVENAEGYTAAGNNYVSYEIIGGKPGIEGLPASFGDASEVSTLVLHCADKPNKLKIDLYYSVFEDVDVITRFVTVTNEGSDFIFLKKLYSACLDMENKDFETITLHGSWARERHIENARVGHMKYTVESIRGESSHQDHPFLGVKSHGTTDDFGEVYAMNFVYSGNFKATVQEDQFDNVRMTMGINPDNFKWCLKPGEKFNAPEVVMVYSASGLGNMSRTFHDFYRKHLIRSPYLHKKRPILINNWEATYFDFNSEKLVSIARQAHELGIEMLVMDDGWFSNRFDDNRSLGDWWVNEDKLPGGLKPLVDKVNEIGMKFGIWFEPEMISPESELYKKHPDWAIAVLGREPAKSRNQFVLDLSRPEVVDYMYEQVAKILRSANIEYVKWDMNRQLTDLGSAYLPPERMGELSHRYVLGLYSMQERLLKEFPNLLLENCSGGGARFDAGELYYSPQIWCSDDTDAIERLSIQEGTSLVYPLSTMGAHVSDVPNHTVGRVTPFETRGHVALFGTFGYELDVTKISQEDRDMIRTQTEMYHRYNDLVREGDYYRIASYRQNGSFDMCGVVSKDKKEAVFVYVQVLAEANMHARRIRLKGLKEDLKYRVSNINESAGKAEVSDGASDAYAGGPGMLIGGDVLMNFGILLSRRMGDFKSSLIHITSAE